MVGRARDGATTIDLLAHAPGVTLKALFSPEHGIRGGARFSRAGQHGRENWFADSLALRANERPTPAMLEGLDAIVIDLQEIGARFYTYMTTVAYVMEEAAPRKIKVIVLDRPNPIGGVEVEGPALDVTSTSFVGYLPAMPIRHGLTLGEVGAAVQR